MKSGIRFIAFDAFEMDVKTGELRKHGLPLKLQPQPFRVLALLATHPGELITRQRLREELWGDAVVVEFDAGLNYCIRQIRGVLCDDSLKPRYIETLSKRGYRFLASTVCTPEPDADAPLAATPAQEAPAELAGKRQGSRRWMLAAGGAALGGLALGLAWSRRRDTRIRAVAVLPFESAVKDADLDYLSNGLTESLIRQVSAMPELTVRPWSAVSGFRAGRTDPQAAGVKLQVDAVVSGRVEGRAGVVSISVELVDVRSGAVLWGERYDRKAADLGRLREEIARAVVERGIRMKLSAEDRRRLARRTSPDSEANELYLRALFHQEKSTEEGYLTARQLLLKATERDERFALAFALLAANYAVTAVDGYAAPADSWPLVRTCAQQALLLEGGLREPHLELASEAFYNRWDWAEAEREFQTGSEGGGSHVSEVLGGYAMERWALGDAEDALRLLRRGLALNPVSPVWRRREADLLLWMGRSDQAAAIYEAVIRDDAEEIPAYFGYADALYAQGRAEEAIRQLGDGYAAAGEEDARMLELLKTARGAHGYEQLQRLGAQLELESLLAREAARRYVSALDFARCHARLGRKREALELLEAAFADRCPGLVFLKVDAAWNRVRSEKAFQEAVRKVGLA